MQFVINRASYKSFSTHVSALKSAAPIVFALLSGMVANTAAFGQIAEWQALKQLKDKYTFPVYLRDGRCYSANIVKYGVDSINIHWSGWEGGHAVGGVLNLPKANILQIGSLHNVIWSGRSSWDDVRAASPSHAEFLQVVLRSGERISGKAIASDDTEITLEHLGSNRIIKKENALRVDYIRQFPITDDEQYLLQEANALEVFNPDTWARALGVSRKLDVQLFDASHPEANRALGFCKNPELSTTTK